MISFGLIPGCWRWKRYILYNLLLINYLLSLQLHSFLTFLVYNIRPHIRISQLLRRGIWSVHTLQHWVNFLRARAKPVLVSKAYTLSLLRVILAGPRCPFLLLHRLLKQSFSVSRKAWGIYPFFLCFDHRVVPWARLAIRPPCKLSPFPTVSPELSIPCMWLRFRELRVVERRAHSVMDPASKTLILESLSCSHYSRDWRRSGLYFSRARLVGWHTSSGRFHLRVIVGVTSWAWVFIGSRVAIYCWARRVRG